MMRKRYEQLFLQLLRSTLWNKPTDISQLTDEEYEGVMLIAGRQRTEACIGEALVRGNVRLGREKVAHVMAVIQATERENILMNRQLTFLTEHLCRHDIEYYVVKGQVVGMYYPLPSVRQSGDIDIFFPEGSYTAGTQLAKRLGLEAYRGHEKGKHQIFLKDGVVFEFHHHLLQLATPWHRRCWESYLKETGQGDVVTINGCCVRTLPLCHHLVYVFLHLFFHLITSGVGMRQLCDMAILLRRCYEKGVDWQEVTTIMESLGCTRAFHAVLACCVLFLGVSVNLPVILQQKDFWWGERIFQNIMRGGNFALYQRRVSSDGLLHRMETAWMIMRRTFDFYPLAPQESLLRVWTITKDR